MKYLGYSKRDGIFAMLNNSISDPEYKGCEEIEEGFYRVNSANKRYFSVKTLRPFIAKFKAEVLDDEGETYKDSAKGIHNLIRFVGRKVQIGLKP